MIWFDSSEKHDLNESQWENDSVWLHREKVIHMDWDNKKKNSIGLYEETIWINWSQKMIQCNRSYKLIQLHWDKKVTRLDWKQNESIAVRKQFSFVAVSKWFNLTGVNRSEKRLIWSWLIWSSIMSSFYIVLYWKCLRSDLIKDVTSVASKTD